MGRDECFARFITQVLRSKKESALGEIRQGGRFNILLIATNDLTRYVQIVGEVDAIE